MQANLICVLGGSGFVGRHICAVLAARGYRVRVPTRNRERAKASLILLPTVDVVPADVHDPEQLREVIRGCDAVVNLVGVLQNGRRNASFRGAHVELAQQVAEACRRTGVRRLLHMSSLGAGADAPSAYLRSKGEAEAAVLGSGLDVTVFRPSVVFGPGDSFLNLFARLLRWLPVVLLGSPHARFQPVYVEDVAEAFVHALTDLDTHGQRYDLCGPRVYTLRELVEFVGRTIGAERPVIGLGDGLSYAQAFAMELLPVKLLTRDNYYSMKRDSVCDCAFPFGMTPRSLEALAPAWLANRTPRARYQQFRDHAGR